MTFQEKLLYHQIHWAKLTVDAVTALASTMFLWTGALDAFWIVFLAPSVVASLLVIAFADLEALKASAFGDYVKRYMPKWAQGARIAGQVLIWLSAWTHDLFGITLGVGIIAAAWGYGGLVRLQAGKPS